MVGPPAKVMKLDSGSNSSSRYFPSDEIKKCSVSVRFLIPIFSISIEHINPKKIIEMLAAEYSGSNSAAKASLINANANERQLLKKFVAEMRELEQFFVSLCADVLSDVFRFGNRHRLAKLERVGRRFHRIVGNFFYKAPFIHLDLELKGTKRFLFIILRTNNNENLLLIPYPGANFSFFTFFSFFDQNASSLRGEYPLEKLFDLNF